jgi:signal transduction histidine kinase
MKRSTLQQKFLAHNLLLVLGLVLAGSISIIRLVGVAKQVNVSRSVYAELRTVGSVAVDAGMVQGLLTDPQANRERILTHLNYAIGGLDQFTQVSKGYDVAADKGMTAAYAPMNSSVVSARNHLQEVADQIRRSPAINEAQTAALRMSVDAAMADIDRAASGCIHFISTRQENASDDLTKNLILTGILSAAAVLAAVWLSLLHYRLVMTPLQRLRQGVRRVMEAQFTEKLDPATMGSTPEFKELAVEFNEMASELDGFYRRLEAQVSAKSKQLLRSERLASVGFLAAGVAHEINNPLNIISGYAELTTKQLESDARPLSEEEIALAAGNLRIIREEAFRCKEITEKLLSLSRNGSESRETLDLANVVRDVATMTQGLKPYRGRRLTLKLDSAEPLGVCANLTEMKQVLLNLTINALESVQPVGGEVCIEGRRKNGWVELSVADNGRGMSAEILPHVFEPFFTARRGSDRGTGLGLAITHAIVESHQGRIEAESEGPGHGARFTIRLPASAAGAMVAAS